MNRNSWKWWMIGSIALCLSLSMVLCQSPPAEKPATPPAPQEKPSEAGKKAENEVAPKKKMKKVKTLFGEAWVEDTEAEQGSVPKTPAPGVQTPPQAPPPVGQPPKPEEKKGEVAPAAQPPGAAPAASMPGSGASLVFNNADLVQVVQVIANLLHLNYVMDPNVKGAVTITTLGDISNADLMQILQTILRINGCTAIQTGNLWQIVPLKSAHQIPVALESPDGKPLSLDDRMVTEIISMQFVSAADMSKILKEFLSDAGSIMSHDRGNILIITDASRNMARMLELVHTFDSEAMASQRVQLFYVKNNSARSVIEDLRNIFSAYAMSDKDSAIRFVPIDRLNGILVVAPNPASFDMVAQWISKLDQPAQVAGIRNYVYHVQYAKAVDIRRLLSELYGSVITASDTPGTPRPGSSAVGGPGTLVSTAGLSQSTILSQEKPEQQRTDQQRDVYGFMGSIKVVADQLNNMLIIQATPQDYDLIEQTLRQIDILPRQVLIEAQIFRVDLSHDFSLGVQYALQQRGTATGGTKPLANLTAGALSASSVIMSQGARELFASVTASENRGRAKTLSSPSILATDNMEARIQVGISIPTLSSSGFQPGATNTIFNTVSNVDTGVILSVTPHVSASGMVGMKLTQEVSSPVPPPAGVSNISPSINRSSASTSFIVHDGETVAIAGIITEDKELTRSHIPLLGDIPFLGAAFGNTTYSNKRSELIIFITPHVVNNLDQEKVVTDALREEMKKLKRDIQSNERSYKKIWDKVQPPIPPPASK